MSIFSAYDIVFLLLIIGAFVLMHLRGKVLDRSSALIDRRSRQLDELQDSILKQKKSLEWFVENDIKFELSQSFVDSLLKDPKYCISVDSKGVMRVGRKDAQPKEEKEADAGLPD